MKAEIRLGIAAGAICAALGLTAFGCFAVRKAPEKDARRYSEAASLRAAEKIRREFSAEEYGGVYIGPDGELVVATLREGNPRLRERIVALNGEERETVVRPVVVKYSLRQLEAARRAIEPYCRDYGVAGIGLDEENNRLEIDPEPGSPLVGAGGAAALQELLERAGLGDGMVFVRSLGLDTLQLTQKI